MIVINRYQGVGGNGCGGCISIIAGLVVVIMFMFLCGLLIR